MTRSEIITRFREENPEITSNVASDTVLRSWCKEGNVQVCTMARLIVATGTITAVTTTALATRDSQYDLTSNFTKFFDVDESIGGGVSFYVSSSNVKRLKKLSKAELDDLRPNWKTQSTGTPKNYFRRGKYLNLDPAPNSANTIYVDYVALPDDFDDDAKTPYNQLTHLAPFHYGIVKYLVWQAKAKVGKPEERQNAKIEFEEYIRWIIREIGGGKNSRIYFRPVI